MPETSTSWEHVIQSIVFVAIRSAIDSEPDLSPDSIAQAVITGAMESDCTDLQSLREAIEEEAEAIGDA